MLVNGEKKTSIWYNEAHSVVEILDQSKLPFELVTRQLRSLDDFADAIQHMWVRGAPLIGSTAAFGLAGANNNTCCANLFCRVHDGFLPVVAPGNFNLIVEISSL